MVHFRWSRKTVVNLAAVFLTICLSTKVSAQVVLVAPDGTRKPLVADSTGLAPFTPINRSMFQGIRLSKAQSDSIDRLARYWQRTRPEKLKRVRKERRPASTQEEAERQIERERISYRNVLTVSQQKRYDANTARLLQYWRRGSSGVSKLSEKTP